jgi:ABC-type Fe3+-hydroxamate transport system substrate-binding protein
VGDCFKPSNGKAQKGHYPVRKKKGGMLLDPLIASNPDVIVMTGDAFAVQKAFADYQTGNPAFAQVKAIRILSLYALPAYVDSGVLEYPAVLEKWINALGK